MGDGDSGRTADAERKFVQSMVQYDAVTQRREAYQTLARRTNAAELKMGGCVEQAMANMGFIVRHSADEIRHLLPRLQFRTQQARAPKASTHCRLATVLAVQQRHALLENKATAEEWLKEVHRLTTFEPRKVEALDHQAAIDQLRTDTSDDYAEDFKRQIGMGHGEVVGCQKCGVCNCLPFWLPCCKQNSLQCSTCVLESLHDERGQALSSIACPQCGEHLPRAKLQAANRAGSWLRFNIVHERRLERTMRGQALLQNLSRGQKVLLAGVKATEERAQICEILTRKGISHCCPGETGRGVDALNQLREFAQAPDVRVLILPKYLKQGVDHLKAAKKIVFWDTEHLDYRNLVNRHSIIKRVCRLGCEHKSIEVVTLQQSFLEASDLGADRSALRSVHLCPLEDLSDDSDAVGPAPSRKRPAEIPTEMLQERSQDSPEKD